MLVRDMLLFLGFGFETQFRKKNLEDSWIEISRHLLVRNVRFELVVTSPAEKKDVVVVFPAVVPTWVDMVTSHQCELITRRTDLTDFVHQNPL